MKTKEKRSFKLTAATAIATTTKIVVVRRNTKEWFE
jgi:hypothetical protein